MSSASEDVPKLATAAGAQTTDETSRDAVSNRDESCMLGCVCVKERERESWNGVYGIKATLCLTSCGSRRQKLPWITQIEAVGTVEGKRAGLDEVAVPFKDVRRLL